MVMMSHTTPDLTPEQAATLADLVQAMSYRRHAYEAARREKERADNELAVYLEGVGLRRYDSDELHISATVVTRRTAKVANETRLAEALNEIGLVIPRKESVDASELLKIADRYGGDFPGVEVTETTSLMVKGHTR